MRQMIPDGPKKVEGRLRTIFEAYRGTIEKLRKTCEEVSKQKQKQRREKKLKIVPEK